MKWLVRYDVKKGMSLDEFDFDELEKILVPIIRVVLQLLRKKNAALLPTN